MDLCLAFGVSKRSQVFNLCFVLYFPFFQLSVSQDFLRTTKIQVHSLALHRSRSGTGLRKIDAAHSGSCFTRICSFSVGFILICCTNCAGLLHLLWFCAVTPTLHCSQVKASPFSLVPHCLYSDPKWDLLWSEQDQSILLGNCEIPALPSASGTLFLTLLGLVKGNQASFKVFGPRSPRVAWNTGCEKPTKDLNCLHPWLQPPQSRHATLFWLQWPGQGPISWSFLKGLRVFAFVAKAPGYIQTRTKWRL